MRLTKPEKVTEKIKNFLEFNFMRISRRRREIRG